MKFNFSNEDTTYFRIRFSPQSSGKNMEIFIEQMINFLIWAGKVFIFYTISNFF
jgi:hypothetical protein